MSILPFLLVGIGVDSVFILVAAHDYTDAALSSADRMAETLRTGGVSVTVAAFTNVFAFLIGANTSLPGLRAFAIYTAFALFFDWMFQVRTLTFSMATQPMGQSAKAQSCYQGDILARSATSPPVSDNVIFLLSASAICRQESTFCG